MAGPAATRSDVDAGAPWGAVRTAAGAGGVMDEARLRAIKRDVMNGHIACRSCQRAFGDLIAALRAERAQREQAQADLDSFLGGLFHGLSLPGSFIAFDKEGRAHPRVTEVIQGFLRQQEAERDALRAQVERLTKERDEQARLLL